METWPLRALVFTLLSFFCLAAAAQGYPAKPVRMVVPASPGGATDVAARLIAPGLGDALGQPFIVENRVTSGGIIATQQVAESPADGYTLLVTFDTFASNPTLYKNLKWDPVRDFAPVMQFCRYPQVLLTHPSLNVRTVKEFVALAKKRGPQLNYGSAGPASSSRLAYELFKDVAGIETVPVHYKGGGPAIQDLLSGQVQVMLIQGGGSVAQHVKSGKLMALGISSLAPSKFFPGVPPIAETYPGFETDSWVAMVAPAGTPRSIIDQLNGALRKLFADATVRERFEAQSCDIVAGTPEALGRLVKSEREKWAKVIREKNITVE